MRKAFLASIAVMLLALLAGCGTYSENGVTAKGMGLEVVIEGNPTTGYQWTCTTDETAIVCTGSEYTPSNTDGMIVGAGGEYTFSFMGVPGSGTRTTEIEFTYARSWEAGSACRWRTVKVEVTAGGKVSVISVVDRTN